ncbi:zinc-ribbon domain-containing protein [Macrococcoides goetzii]|uniref:TcaA second domain-containing protein n=1 Tax=Macrococcus sp. PK TaxID=2801919 RepID=UPI001F0EF00B|nr:zinc-ribbon domain-containing protein [Macrococcus sp. PK]MCH4985890.1 zinc-ribbon domain-containing protein [Macrococcus sp. PK]MCH4986085.1 zinc-ribbon domain-containing protein [Macrococcus sp. PK]
MKICRNCGAEVKDHVKVCTNCGTKFPEDAVQERRVPSDEKLVYERKQKQPVEKPVKKSKGKSRLPLLIGLLALLALLFGLYKFFEHKFSPVNQSEEIKQALIDKDYNKLSSILSVGDKNLSESEAEAFAHYIAASGDTEKFGEKLVTTTEQMIDNKQPDSMVNVGGKDAIQIASDKKKFGMFKNFSFKVPEVPIYLTGKDGKKIVIKVNGEEQDYTPTLNSRERLGNFPLGNYELDATKTAINGEVQGKLLINMSESDDAQESFDVAYIKTNVEIPEAVDKDSVMVYVNNEEMDFDVNGDNVFGPFLAGKKLKIYAEGEAGNQTLVTNKEIETPSASSDNPADIDLIFDTSELTQEPAKETIIVRTSDEEDASEQITVTRENVQSLAETWSGVGFDYGRYEYRTPVYENGKYGFGIFDENGEIVGSFDVYKDGTIIEYDEDGEIIRNGNIND